MKFSGAFKLSSRAYRARPLRTFLTVFGMSIGMSAVLFLVSLGYGLQEEMLRRVTTSDTIYTLTIQSAQEKKDQLMSFDRVEMLRTSPGIAEVAGSRDMEGSGRMDELTSNLTVSFLDEAYLRLSGARVVAGSIDGQIGSREVIMSTGSARLFSKDPEELVGKRVEIWIDDSYNEEGQSYGKGFYGIFTIRGVIQSEENGVYMPLSASNFDIQALSYDDLKIRIEKKENIENFRNLLIEEGYTVSAIADIVKQIRSFFLVVQFILGSFGVVALFVSAIGMFNTMTVALFERTQEIGIMKSIGATDKYIAVLFVIESFLMGIFGGLLGIVIAYIEMTVINVLINIVAVRFGGESVDLFFTPLWFIVLVFIFSGIVGIITGSIPAKRASKLDTLTALQYK